MLQCIRVLKTYTLGIVLETKLAIEETPLASARWLLMELLSGRHITGFVPS